jgi:hypothetical protein
MRFSTLFNFTRGLAASCLVASGLFACGGEDEPNPPPAEGDLEVVGAYDTQFGTSETKIGRASCRERVS